MYFLNLVTHISKQFYSPIILSIIANFIPYTMKTLECNNYLVKHNLESQEDIWQYFTEIILCANNLPKAKRCHHLHMTILPIAVICANVDRGKTNQLLSVFNHLCKAP